jgi:hypothetical protein
MLGWLVNEHAIEPHIPVFDKSARDDGTFSREDFAYDQEHDLYVCPAGKVLSSTGTLVNDGATLRRLLQHNRRKAAVHRHAPLRQQTSPLRLLKSASEPPKQSFWKNA